VKRWINWAVIAVVVLVVLAYMTTFKVRFTENAVLTTFGKADESSVIREPGLRFKIPYVQRETKYDTRDRLLETQSETIQTSDQRQVVVRVFLTWRVADPLAFYQKYSGKGDRAEDHYKAAETDLRGRLRSIASAKISAVPLSEILAASPGGSRLGDLEKAMLADLAADGQAASSFASFGVEPRFVGISSIKFPLETTRKVFDAMNAERAKIANAAISQGTTQADTIRKTAETDSQTIMEFAQRQARMLRSQGDAEASQYLAQMAEEPQLAVFLKNMEFLREVVAKQATVILSTAIPGFEFLRFDALRRERGAHGLIPTERGMRDAAAILASPAPPASAPAEPPPAEPRAEPAPGAPRPLPSRGPSADSPTP
jgi:membrane protease subunit HflC